MGFERCAAVASWQSGRRKPVGLNGSEWNRFHCDGRRRRRASELLLRMPNQGGIPESGVTPYVPRFGGRLSASGHR